MLEGTIRSYLLIQAHKEEIQSLMLQFGVFGRALTIFLISWLKYRTKSGPQWANYEYQSYFDLT